MTKFWKFPSVKRTMGDREEPSPKRRGRRTIQLPHPEALLDSTGNPIASSSNQEVMSQELNPNLNKETYPILEDPNKMPVEELSKPSTNEALQRKEATQLRSECLISIKLISNCKLKKYETHK